MRFILFLAVGSVCGRAAATCVACNGGGGGGVAVAAAISSASTGLSGLAASQIWTGFGAAQLLPRRVRWASNSR